MARPLCTNCFKCRGLTEKGVDCKSAGMIVKPVFRKDIEDGRFENCHWRNRRASSRELKLINLIIRLFGNWDEENGKKRKQPKRLNTFEIAEIEAQVRKCGEAKDYVPMLQVNVA